MVKPRPTYPVDPDAHNDPYAMDDFGDGWLEHVQRVARMLDHEIETSMVAQVEFFEEKTQTVQCVPVTKKIIRGIPYAWPPFPGVPLVFMAGGGRSQTFRPKKGDYVLMCFSKTPYYEWRNAGGCNHSPYDHTVFGMGHPIAIPGPQPPVRPLHGVKDDAWRMGDDRYLDPEGTAPLGNFRVADDVIEVVVSERVDEDGEALADRLMRIDKATGAVTMGEEERGVVVDDDGIRVEDGDASVVVRLGEVKAQVGGTRATVTASSGVVVESAGVTMGLDGAGMPFLKKTVEVLGVPTEVDLFEALHAFFVATKNGGPAELVVASTAMELVMSETFGVDSTG